MFHFIHKLQQKPEPTRRRLAFSVSLVATLAIVGVWLTTLPSRTSSDRRTRTEELGVTPLRSLGESFSALFSEVAGQLRSGGDGPAGTAPPPPSVGIGVSGTTSEAATPGAADGTAETGE